MKTIIYVLDSLRADHLSCFGYQRDTSPCIDKVAADGVKFTRCYAPSTWTRPVAASILSGTYPSVHGLQARRDIFTSNVPRISSFLQSQGFGTACVSAIGNVSTSLGFSEGFDYFCDLYKEPDLLAIRRRTRAEAEGLDEDVDVIFPLAEDLNTYLIPWLDTHKNQDAFALLWSIQTHAPFEPPDGFAKFVGPDYDGRFTGRRDMVRLVRNDVDRKYLVDLYDSEIYYNDYTIGRLVDHLKQTDQYDDTMLIILGDHGEAFGEHSIYSHGHLPYEEVMRVPLIIKLPDSCYAGYEVTELVSLIDIFPTIADYLGAPLGQDEDSPIMGKSMLPLLNDSGTIIHDFVYSETRYSDAKPAFLAVCAVGEKYIKTISPPLRERNLRNVLKRIVNEKLIWSLITNPIYMLKRYGTLKPQMLFDLNNDPHEMNDLADEMPDVLHKMENELDAWQGKCLYLSETMVSGYLSKKEDEVIRKHLEMLGYM